MLYDDYIENDQEQNQNSGIGLDNYSNNIINQAKQNGYFGTGQSQAGSELHNPANAAADTQSLASTQPPINAGNSAVSNAAGTAGEAAAGNAAAGTAASTAGTAGAEVAAGTAAAPATAGISILIAAGLNAAKKGVKEFQDMTTTSNTTSDQGSGPLAAIVAVFFLFILLFSTFLLKMVPGSNENYKETSYSYSLEEEDKALIEIEFAQSELDEYSYENPLEKGAEAYIFGVDENTGFRNAMHDAITEQCHEIVKNLGHRSLKRFIEKYDRKRSLSNFYLNPWPYDLQESEEKVFPRVGDVMGVGNFEGVQYESYEPQYNDVNYAEVLTILSQNPEYDWRNCKFEKYNEYIRTDDAKKFYYELEVTWVVVYEGEKGTIEGDDGIPIPIIVTGEMEYGSEEEACDSPETMIFEGVTCKRDSYYCNIKVKPFGLRALYLMAEADADEMHNDFYYHKNIEMLDYGEYMERTYLREAVDLAGPSYKEPRDELSTIFDDLEAFYGEGEATGRSAWYYIEDPYNYNVLTGEYDCPEQLRNLTDEEMALLEKYLVEIDGYKVLNFSLDDYIYQLDFGKYMRGDNINSIAKAGCCDCSYYMIMQYLVPELHYSAADIASMSQKYVGSNQMFNSNAYMSQYGYMNGPQWTIGSQDNFNKAKFQWTIAKSIDSQRPAILHIEDRWVSSDGKTVYHGSGNGHFLVAIGYSEDGVYVRDPGSKLNNGRCIPWDEWANAGGDGNKGGLYVREIVPIGG